MCSETTHSNRHGLDMFTYTKKSQGSLLYNNGLVFAIDNDIHVHVNMYMYIECTHVN